MIKEIFLPILLFLGIGLFWYFRYLGPSPINSVFAGALFLGSVYFYIKRKEEFLEFLVFLIVFLGFSILYTLQFAFSLPLWLSEILVFIFTFCIFIYLASETRLFQNRLLFGLALSICLLEIFFVLFFWPTNPLSKSFILTSLFYAFWYIVIKREKVLNYLVLIAVVLVLVIATTRWPVI